MPPPSPVGVDSQIGPYRLLQRLGSGGMGEVWRGRDDRLQRDVAIKILRFTGSPSVQAVSRFHQEARAIAALSHPNVLSVFDVGEADGHHYMATEILDGVTLAQRIGGAPLPVVLAVDIAVQITRGLEAAHSRGIVHRDLKPANVFLTRAGHVKVLDFGLAQLSSGPAELGEATVDWGSDVNSDVIALKAGPATATGTILGTVGYMSPEQARGEPADARSDLFALGVVLYEMLTGVRPFVGTSAVETLHATLVNDPPELGRRGARVGPTLDRLVRRCLEKDPAARFQSASDLSFALQALPLTEEVPRVPPAPHARWRPPRHTLSVVVGLGLLGAGVAVGRSAYPPLPEIEVEQVTFRSGAVDGARFTPDGHSVVLSARWDGAPPRVEILREGARESSVIDGAVGQLVAVSTTDIYVLEDTHLADTAEVGRLARIPLAGGPSRVLAERAYAMDFGGINLGGKGRDGIDRSGSAVNLNPSDGSALVVTPRGLERPLGTLLTDGGRPIAARASPDGAWVAWIDRARSGAVALMELKTGQSRHVILPHSASGIAWHPITGALWASSPDTLGSTSIWAISPEDGARRLVRRSEGQQQLHDLSAEGEALIEVNTIRRETFAQTPGAEGLVRLGWLAWTAVAGLSADRTTVLLNDWPAVYLRNIDGSPPVRIAEGWALDLSPDGAWALVTPTIGAPRLLAVPTGAGSPRVVLGEEFTVIGAAFFHAGGTRVSALARRGDERERIWDVAFDGGGLEGGGLQGGGLEGAGLEGGEPVALTEPGTDLFYGQRAWSPDGRTLATTQTLVTVGAGSRPIVGLAPEDAILRWTADGRGLWVMRREGIPAELSILDPDSGARTPMGVLDVADRDGVRRVDIAMVSDDGSTRVWTADRESSTLYIVSGLR